MRPTRRAEILGTPPPQRPWYTAADPGSGLLLRGLSDRRPPETLQGPLTCSERRGVRFQCKHQSGFNQRTGPASWGEYMNRDHWFGPFGEHTVNPSWVAVQELKKLGLGSDVDLQVYEVPVEYHTVRTLVPALWKQYHPLLVIHVGVSETATTVTLEKCGRNHGYRVRDNSGLCPEAHCCVAGGPDYIDSGLDLDSVCKRVSSTGIGVTVSLSKDAGRYLCDFTYYTSLYVSRGRSAFVHVPPLGKPYDGEELGLALQTIVLSLLELLEDQDQMDRDQNLL
uniref:Pyroglutamyl-peptidase I n=1 Tax=Knipowitschia caucasica TaxID=637954 RepID=A0AAV2KPD0_KNICA